MDDLDIEELPINSEVADAVRNLRIADVVRFCIDKENHSGRIVMMQFDNVTQEAIGISIALMCVFFEKSGHESRAIFPTKKYGGEFEGSAFWSRIVKMGGWIRDKSQCTAYEVSHFSVQN